MGKALVRPLGTMNRDKGWSKKKSMHHLYKGTVGKPYSHSWGSVRAFLQFGPRKKLVKSPRRSRGRMPGESELIWGGRMIVSAALVTWGYKAQESGLSQTHDPFGGREAWLGGRTKRARYSSRKREMEKRQKPQQNKKNNNTGGGGRSSWCRDRPRRGQ